MLVLSLCTADFGAFAATRGVSAPAGNSTASAVGNTAARAGKKQTVKPATTSTVSSAASTGGVAARAGKKQTVKPAITSTSSAATGQPMAARAGATQKVLQTGSKVSTAASNTAIPQECQDSFYGCMDAFCMMDNASGGRCQCNDRVTELDKVLEEILKLDERTYIMATEGVERIQMGEAADQIMARAKAAADGVSVKDGVAIGGQLQSSTSSSGIKKITTRQLDLSAWNKSIFDEDDEEDSFAQIISSSDNVASFADKKGDELYRAAAKECVKIIPDQCKQYNSMVQLVYSQKIKSDCTAYENALKQQRSASQQKLLAAEKALRDAALDEYNDQNKYVDAGSCAVAFAQCMQTTAGCGSDYTGCVTLSAQDNVRGGAKQTTIQGVVSGADITLAASTMEALLAKKEICAHITRQCVNSNKNDEVWTVFLRNAAPALKSAEETAEQRLRMNCIPTLADCFKEACKSTIDPNNAEGSYDMCLSNPETYKSLCKIQLEPCLAATGGSYAKPEKSSLWKGLKAALAAMKVDACTQEITTCLTDRCDKDFSGCIGLSSDAIIDLCPTDKLTACQKENGYGEEGKQDIKDYVVSIAQGLELKMNNSLIEACQNAVNTAMKNACGEANTCTTITLPEQYLRDLMRPIICASDGTCGPIEKFTDAQVLAGLRPAIDGRPNLSVIDYSISVEKGQTSVKDILEQDFFKCEGCKEGGSSKLVADLLNKSWQTKIGQITSDPKVSICIDGRTDMDKSDNEEDKKGKGFSNLTQNAQMVIANTLMDNIREVHDKIIEEITLESFPTLTSQIQTKLEAVKAEQAAKEAANNSMLESICKSYESMSEGKPSVHGCRYEYVTYTATYNKSSKTCSVVKKQFGRRGCRCGFACPFNDDPEKSKSKQFSETDLLKGAQPFNFD